MSRGLVLLLLVVGSQIAFLGKVYSSSVWETRIELQAARVTPELVRVAMVGDSWFYRSLAINGYDTHATPEQAPNWAFFPLFPLMVRVFGPTGEFALDGMIISHIAFGIALCLFGSLLTGTGLDPADAERGIWYLAFFPTSYFSAVVFPLFAWLSVLGRRPAVDRVITAVAITLLGWLVAFLILRVDFALA